MSDNSLRSLIKEQVSSRTITSQDIEAALKDLKPYNPGLPADRGFFVMDLYYTVVTP